MRRTPALAPLLAFVTIAAVAMGLLAILRRGPDEPSRPSPPPVTTTGPSVVGIDRSPSTSPSTSASPAGLSSASPPPVALDPPESPQAPPGECSTSSTIREFALGTIGAIARGSDAIVVATVLQVGTARWDTVDGRPPDRHDRDAFHVVRLVRIRVDDTLAGDLEFPVVALPGGVIGCWQFLMDYTPSDVQPGERYVLVVWGAPHDPRIAGIALVSETWRFEGGRVWARESGPLTLAELRAAIAAP